MKPFIPRSVTFEAYIYANIVVTDYKVHMQLAVVVSSCKTLSGLNFYAGPCEDNIVHVCFSGKKSGYF